MQSIITKFLPATNTRGSRIKARCERGSLTVPYPHELSGEAVHVYACRQLREKFAREDAQEYGTPIERSAWLAPMVCGGLPSGEYAHVFAPRCVVATLNEAARGNGDLAIIAKAALSEIGAK